MSLDNNSILTEFLRGRIEAALTDTDIMLTNSQMEKLVEALKWDDDLFDGIRSHIIDTIETVLGFEAYN